MYDMPTQTKAQVKDATKFKKYIESIGFIRMQFSIYVYLAINHAETIKIHKYIKNQSPKGGNIRILTITEKQYNNIIFINGEKTPEEANQTIDRIKIY